MANRTDASAISVHGTDPQYLIEKILRTKIHEAPYWKEHCFGLTAESLVDKAVELQYIGGTFGGNRKPTPFMCLMLKMLQIQPEREIIIEFILNDDYKYVRILGAFYLRLIGRPVEIYQYLEPLLNDYRKVRHKEASGKVVVTNVDVIIDNLLTQEFFMDITLPRLARRQTLEETNKLPPRESALDELNAKEIDDDKEETKDTTSNATATAAPDDDATTTTRTRAPVTSSPSITDTSHINEDDDDDDNDSLPSKTITSSDNKINSSNNHSNNNSSNQHHHHRHGHGRSSGGHGDSRSRSSSRSRSPSRSKSRDKRRSSKVSSSSSSHSSHSSRSSRSSRSRRDESRRDKYDASRSRSRSSSRHRRHHYRSRSRSRSRSPARGSSGSHRRRS